MAKKYKGIVLIKFAVGNKDNRVNYNPGDPYETTKKFNYDYLINEKKIKAK
jgi:hypothetical protein